MRYTRARMPRMAVTSSGYLTTPRQRFTPQQARDATRASTVRSTSYHPTFSPVFRNRGMMGQMPDEVISPWMQKLGWGLIITTSALALWDRFKG